MKKPESNIQSINYEPMFNRLKITFTDYSISTYHGIEPFFYFGIKRATYREVYLKQYIEGRYRKS